MKNAAAVENASAPTRYWHPVGDGRVQCDLCPRHCRLREGQRGFCHVRQCLGGEVRLATYGQSTGLCVDPIEKKPLHHFFPGSDVLSFGTVGCNLACKFCQNWHISKSKAVGELADAGTPEQLARTAAELRCQSVAFTYNDPVIFHEYAIDVAAACRARAIHSVAVTAGYVDPEPRREFFTAMDAVNVDLKSFSEAFYRKVCGAHLGPVLETLEYVRRETACWLEITTLLIPGYNDSTEEIDRMTRWVVDHLGNDVPMHFSAFHPDWKLRDVGPTPASTLIRARTIAMANGVRYAYTGNVRDRTGGSTWCPSCGALLIERDGYRLGAWGLDARGQCRACAQPVAGRFESAPQPDSLV